MLFNYIYLSIYLLIYYTLCISHSMLLEYIIYINVMLSISFGSTYISERLKVRANTPSSCWQTETQFCSGTGQKVIC